MDIPRLSPKEAEILRLLIDNGEMYGLELVKASTTLKRGTVYVTLSRMDEKGYVASRFIPKETAGPPNRAYFPTGLGIRIYRAWQTAAASFEAAWAI